MTPSDKKKMLSDAIKNVTKKLNPLMNRKLNQKAYEKEIDKIVISFKSDLLKINESD